MQSELDAFKKVRESNDVEQIKAAQETFTQKVYEIFGKIYQQQQQSAGQPGPDAGAGAQGGADTQDGHVDTDYDVH